MASCDTRLDQGVQQHPDVRPDAETLGLARGLEGSSSTHWGLRTLKYAAVALEDIAHKVINYSFYRRQYVDEEQKLHIYRNLSI